MKLQYRYLIYTLAIVFLATGISSCRVKPPEVRGLENYRLDREGTQFRLAADLVMYNPNLVRFTVKNLAGNVAVNDKKVVMIGEEMNLTVAGMKEFKIPINITFGSKETNLTDMLGTAMDIFQKKQMKLSFYGNIKFKAYCVLRKSVPFNYSKNVNLAPSK